MFFHRARVGRVEIAFTDRHDGVSTGGRESLNLGSSGGDAMETVVENHRLLAAALDVDGLSSMSQVHGAEVVTVDRLRADGSGTVPVCDAVVTRERGLALLVRVADCVPVLLADERAGLVGAVHAGRVGLVAGVVPAAVEELRRQGATEIHAWVGPRACGSCYELPEEMADAVDAAVPGTRSTTSWGTPAVDVGRGVVAQLTDLGVEFDDLGDAVCTLEDDRFFSYRRQGVESGRFGGVVVLR